MTKHSGKRFILLALLAINVLSSCRIYDDRLELPKDGPWRFYSINSETILNQLDRGNMDVFNLLAATPEVISSIPATSIHWTQADYFRIAQALHQRSLGEPLGDQNLYSVSFTMGCSEIEQGTFSRAEFESFKVIQTGEEETRFERSMTITPLENSVNILEVQYQPSVKIRKSFSLTQYRITAEEGLQIAEKNGGSKIRLGVNNKCQISAIAPSSDGKGWHITYGTRIK